MEGREFRTFLLYTGINVLKDVLPQDKYEHFLLLHVAIRILCSARATEPQINFAKRCLHNFVSLFDSLYGRQHLVYNVHNLLHLADDRVHFKKPLDSYSSFPFENYLGKIKNLLRGTRKPLSQLFRRITEIERYERLNLAVDVRGDSFLKSFQCGTKTDSFYVIGNGVVVKLLRIVNNVFWGVPLELKEVSDRLLDFYNNPLFASNIGILMSNKSGAGLDEVSYSIEMLRNGVKCIALPLVNNDDADDDDDDDDPDIEYLIIPLLHET